MRADLERCLEAYEARGDIPAFPLGSRDISDRFDIPPRLYGRQEERTALLAAFDRVVHRGTPAVFLIAGATGVGKTALVGELQEPVVQARAFFAVGKCDQYRRDTPYQVLSQACGALVRQLLSRSEDEMGRWRSSLLEAVGMNGRLITDLVPELTPVIGEQAPVVELPVSQAETRFFQVFWRFLNVFASAEHPLVLFLDDLQWADSASLRLLQHIMEDKDSHHLLLIGALRPGEVTASHPLRLMLEELQRRAIELQEVTLQGLSVAEVDHLLQETLHHPLLETQSLAALIHQRAAGNPFYTRELLTGLYREGLFTFDARTATWSWDLAAIRAKPSTDNVADFMVERLAQLPPATLALLRSAAALGGRFELQRLATIAERPLEQVRRDLFPAIRDGLLFRSDSRYEFAHDRVQQAAYALVEAHDRPALHWRIGRLLAGDAPLQGLGDEIFEVASHLTRGASTITDPQERRQVAALDLEAGRRARAGAAYALAAEHLSAGIVLLDASAWEQDHDTAYDLHFELAQCRYLTANPAEAERLLAVMFEHARTKAETAALYRMKVELTWLFNDLDGAIDAVLACLRLFDVVLDRHPSRESAAELYDRVTAALGDRPIEALSELPPARSPEIEQLLATLSTAFPCAYWYDENLHFSLSSLAVRVAIENGLSPGAAHAFADFGMIIGARLGRYKDGYRFGRVAIDVVAKPGYGMVRSRVYMVFGGMTSHWTRPLSESALLEKAFASGLEIGDLLHASISSCMLVEQMLGAGVRLDLAHDRASSFRRFLRKAKFLAMEETVAFDTQLIASLRGIDDAPSSATTWWRDPERQPQSRFANAPSLIAKLQAAFLFGDYEAAADLAFEIVPVVYQIRGYWRVADYHFLSALALAARWPHVGEEERRRIDEQLRAHRHLYAAWAACRPENFLNRYALIRAEMAALAGEDQEATRRYEEAISESRKAGSLLDEALAYEVAARFYRARNIDLFADTCLREARSCYRQWGAEGKVRWLEAHHPQLGAAAGEAPERAPAPVAQVDIEALATSLRAISGEIERSNLLSTVMRVLMQQAGADRGVFLRVASGTWSAEVEGVLAGDEVVVRAMPSAPNGAVVVPASVIGRATRLGEPVVLADAGGERGTGDGDGNYFAVYRPRSVLCLPVIRSATVVGAIYLENKTLKGAFSPATIRTTELLALQIAISLENAELYGGLLKENTQRRTAETALGASRAHLDNVLNHMVDGVIASDPTGRITLVNRAFEQLTGLTRFELEATPFAKLAATIRLGSTEKQSLPEASLPLRRALGGETCVDVPATLVHGRTDKRAYVRISSSPILGAAGEVLGAVSVLHDVTSTTQLELMKDQFIQVAAHELKTPVTIIRMGAQQLLRTPVTQAETIRERAEVLARGTDRIHRIVDAIVLMSSLQRGRLELALEAVDLAPLLLEVAGEVARASRRPVRARTEPALVRGDRERLKDVLTQLIDNAVRYSPGGEQVDADMVQTRSDVVVHVRDRGVGIPRDKQRHIFERFFRAHTDTPYDSGGMGVGLYLSQTVARQHGGDIWFESTEGSGSTFHLRLPLLAAPQGAPRP